MQLELLLKFMGVVLSAANLADPQANRRLLENAFVLGDDSINNKRQYFEATDVERALLDSVQAQVPAGTPVTVQITEVPTPARRFLRDDKPEHLRFDTIAAAQAGLRSTYRRNKDSQGYAITATAFSTDQNVEGMLTEGTAEDGFSTYVATMYRSVPFQNATGEILPPFYSRMTQRVIDNKTYNIITTITGEEALKKMHANNHCLEQNDARANEINARIRAQHGRNLDVSPAQPFVLRDFAAFTETAANELGPENLVVYVNSLFAQYEEMLERQIGARIVDIQLAGIKVFKQAGNFNDISSATSFIYYYPVENVHTKFILFSSSEFPYTGLGGITMNNLHFSAAISVDNSIFAHEKSHGYGLAHEDAYIDHNTGRGTMPNNLVPEVYALSRNGYYYSGVLLGDKNSHGLEIAINYIAYMASGKAYTFAPGTTHPPTLAPTRMPSKSDPTAAPTPRGGTRAPTFDQSPSLASGATVEFTFRPVSAATSFDMNFGENRKIIIDGRSNKVYFVDPSNGNKELSSNYELYTIAIDNMLQSLKTVQPITIKIVNDGKNLTLYWRTSNSAYEGFAQLYLVFNRQEIMPQPVEVSTDSKYINFAKVSGTTEPPAKTTAPTLKASTGKPTTAPVIPTAAPVMPTAAPTRRTNASARPTSVPTRRTSAPATPTSKSPSKGPSKAPVKPTIAPTAVGTTEPTTDTSPPTRTTTSAPVLFSTTAPTTSNQGSAEFSSAAIAGLSVSAALTAILAAAAYRKKNEMLRKHRKDSEFDRRQSFFSTSTNSTRPVVGEAAATVASAAITKPTVQTTPLVIPQYASSARKLPSVTAANNSIQPKSDFEKILDSLAANDTSADEKAQAIYEVIKQAQHGPKNFIVFINSREVKQLLQVSPQATEKLWSKFQKDDFPNVDLNLMISRLKNHTNGTKSAKQTLNSL